MSTITVNNTKLTPPEGQQAAGVNPAQQFNSAFDAADQPKNTPAAEPVVAPPTAAPLPITHQSHPFWAGFSWPVALHTLQLLATVAPIVVAIADKKDPAAVEETTQLSGLTGAIAGELLKSQSQQ